MLTPVVCNCGLPIGDIARKFIEMRNELTKEELKNLSSKADPNNIIYLTTESGKSPANINLEPIFKELGDPPLCCRTQLSTNMLFSDYY